MSRVGNGCVTWVELSRLERCRLFFFSFCLIFHTRLGGHLLSSHFGFGVGVQSFHTSLLALIHVYQGFADHGGLYGVFHSWVPKTKTLYHWLVRGGRCIGGPLSLPLYSFAFCALWPARVRLYVCGRWSTSQESRRYLVMFTLARALMPENHLSTVRSRGWK